MSIDKPARKNPSETRGYCGQMYAERGVFEAITEIAWVERVSRNDVIETALAEFVDRWTAAHNPLGEQMMSRMGSVLARQRERELEDTEP